MHRLHRVVIIGGGFGGLYATQSLQRAPVQITLLDRRNFHLFQPLLYQVATGWLAAANIATPLREVVKRQQNARVLLADVVDIDVAQRHVQLRDGEHVPYDTLLVAAGAQHHYFGHAEWEAHAPGLKTIEDAVAIRRRILLAFEAAEREADPHKQAAWLTFVIVGGGPTGVELAGTLAELARDTLKHDFRRIDPASARIVLLEGLERVLPPYPPALSAKAARALEQLGVQLRTRTVVTEIFAHAVTVQCDGQLEAIPTRTVVWAAGVQASPLGRIVANATGAPVDRAGRVMVQPDCSLPGHPEVFVIGDLAHYATSTGTPLPGVAPVAMQQGRYVARLIQQRLRGQRLPTFRYRDRGSLAIVGRAKAVADLGKIHLTGGMAWLVWLLVHLTYLIAFQNRLLVCIQWAGNYLTRNRGARLIIAEPSSVSIAPQLVPTAHTPKPSPASLPQEQVIANGLHQDTTVGTTPSALSSQD